MHFEVIYDLQPTFSWLRLLVQKNFQFEMRQRGRFIYKFF